MLTITDDERCIPNMLKQLRPHVGGLRWLGVL